MSVLKQNESPATRHGRLMEAIHISGYSFVRAADDLEYLLEEDRWKQCGGGYEDIHEFLGTVDLSPFKIEATKRKKLAKRLAELDASQRATAKAIGVTHTTIQKDLDSGNKLPPNTEKPPETSRNSVVGGNKLPPKPDSGIEAAIKLENRNVVAAKHTGDEESYTPEKYIVSARAVMGGIDTDPASNEVAQKIVGAGTYYTVADDGLSKEWAGRVWMNPPYTARVINEFVSHLVRQYQSGICTEAIALTNNNTDTSWFHELLDAGAAVCFTRGRINFYKESGETTSPTNGQAFFYLGVNMEEFREEFSKHGAVLNVAK